MSVEPLLVQALSALVAGDPGAARRAATAAAAAGGGSRLAPALAAFLDAGGRGPVYDQPAAFEAFIRGGGNTALYASVSRALAEAYEEHRVTRVLDVGCGDGTAVVPALTRARHLPEEVDLLEPSPALLAAAADRLRRARASTTATPWPVTAQDFTADLPAGRRWSLVQATFALQSLPAAERAGVLAALAPRTRRLVVVEFDVPDLAPGGPQHLASLVQRYERGLGEYADDAAVADLVAQGFLMPVLTGQLAPGAVRTNWEQPAPAWAEQVAGAGYHDVAVRHLEDYWSSPAFLLTARGGAGADAGGRV